MHPNHGGGERRCIGIGMNEHCRYVHAGEAGPGSALLDCCRHSVESIIHMRSDHTLLVQNDRVKCRWLDLVGSDVHADWNVEDRRGHLSG